MSVFLFLQGERGGCEIVRGEQADKKCFVEDEAAVQAQAIMDQFKRDNPNAKK